MTMKDHIAYYPPWLRWFLRAVLVFNLLAAFGILYTISANHLGLSLSIDDLHDLLH